MNRLLVRSNVAQPTAAVASLPSRRWCSGTLGCLYNLVTGLTLWDQNTIMQLTPAHLSEQIEMASSTFAKVYFPP